MIGTLDITGKPGQTVPRTYPFGDDIKLTARPNRRKVAKDREQWKSLEKASAKKHFILKITPASRI